MRSDPMATESRLARFLLAGLGLLAWLVIPAPASGQGASLTASEAVERWLFENCAVGEEPVLEARLRALAVETEPLFIEALREGPDGERIEEVERALGRRYDRRVVLLQDAEALGLSESDLEAARGTSREEFVARGREDFVSRYRSQAVSGLGVVGGDRGREILAQLAEDETSPLRIGAREALDRLQEE